MEFPDLVYRTPGEHACKGGTFKSKQVKDAAEHAAALADGWFDTLPEAIEGKPAKAEQPAEGAPPAAKPAKAAKAKAEQPAE